MKTISLYLFAALILAFLAGEIGRGFALGNKALLDIRDRIEIAVSGGR